MYIDTHCHLTDKRYEEINLIVSEYEKYSVSSVITMGCNLTDTIDSLKLAEKYDSIYFGAGVHPTDANKLADGDLDEIKRLATHPKCVCIGEIGLDYYWDKSYNELQKEVLIKQLEFAKELKLPFSFHCREATEDTLKLLKETWAKNWRWWYCNF